MTNHITVREAPKSMDLKFLEGLDPITNKDLDRAADVIVRFGVHHTIRKIFSHRNGYLLTDLSRIFFKLCVDMKMIFMEDQVCKYSRVSAYCAWSHGPGYDPRNSSQARPDGGGEFIDVDNEEYIVEELRLVLARKMAVLHY